MNYGTEEAHDVNKYIYKYMCMHVNISIVNRTLHRSMYIAMPFVTIAYLFINLSYFAVLSVGEITDATAVALVRHT